MPVTTPSPTPPTRTRGERWVIGATFVLAALGAAVTGLACYVGAQLTFFGETTDAADLRAASAGLGATAVAALVLAVPALLGLRPPAVAAVVTLAVPAVLGLAAWATAGDVASAPPAEHDVTWWEAWRGAAGPAVALPTSWPLVVLGLAGLVALVVRARSSRGRR